MPKNYRPITKSEKAQAIGVGLLVALITASAIGFFASFLFQWAAGFFDPTPNAPADCPFTEFLEKTVREYQTCKSQSNSFDTRMERLSRRIPWFWMAFIFMSWVMLKDAFKGRIRDDSEDLSYPGQGVWDFVSTTLGTVIFYILIWVLIARDKSSFIALGLVVGLMLASIATHYWLLKKYGKTDAERSGNTKPSRGAP
ncbi:MAG: hypothetical protein ABJN22_01805 [Litorimonas sp.]